MAKQNPGRVLASAAQGSKSDVDAKLKGVVAEEVAVVEAESAAAAAPVVDAAMLASAESIFAADASPVLVAQAGGTSGGLLAGGISTGTLLAVGAGVLAVGGAVALASSGDDDNDDGNDGGNQPVNPTITVTAAPATISESGAGVTYTISTTGFAAGQQISYSLTGSGITASDVDKDLSGLITLDANGGAVFTVSAAADNTTEGNESIVLNLSSGSTKASAAAVTIADSSVSPPAAAINSVTPSVASITEGAGAVTYTIDTTGFKAGDLLNYVITGVQADDINQPLAGTVVVTAAGTAVLTISAVNDGIVDGPESLKLTVFSGGLTKDSALVSIVDAPNQDFPGTTFTIGQDNLKGTNGNDTFQAPIIQGNGGATQQSVESFDVLDGGDGIDSFVATLTGGGTAVAPVITNVENFEIRSAGSSNGFDFASVSGLKSLEVGGSTTNFYGLNLDASGVTAADINGNAGGVYLGQSGSLTGAVITGNTNDGTTIFLDDATGLLSLTAADNEAFILVEEAVSLKSASFDGNAPGVFTFAGTLRDAESLATLTVSNQNADIEVTNNDVASVTFNLTNFGSIIADTADDFDADGFKDDLFADYGQVFISHADATSRSATFNLKNSIAFVADDSTFTTVKVDAADANFLHVNSFSAKTTALTVTGTGSLVLGTVDNYTGEDATLDPEKNFLTTFTKLATLDASANSGGVAARIDNAASVVLKLTGGLGSDLFEVGGVKASSVIATGGGDDGLVFQAGIGENTTITLGDGNDFVSFLDASVAGTAGKGTTTVSAGAGDDTVVLDDQRAQFKLVDGGAGIDIVNITNGLSSDNSKVGLTGFETLDFSGSTAATYDLAAQQVGGGTFSRVQADQSLADDVVGAVELINAADVQSVFFINEEASDFNIAALKVSAATGFAYKGSAVTLDFTVTDDTTPLAAGKAVGTANADVTFAGVVDVTPFETFNIATHVTPDANLKSGVDNYNVSFNDAVVTDARSITVTGDADVFFNGGLVSNKLISFDASGATGDIFVDLFSADQSVVYNGSSGVDNVATSAFGDTVFGGGSNDLIQLGLPGSDGSDTVIYTNKGGSTQTEVVVKAGLVDLTVIDNFEQIVGFVTEDDKIQIDGFDFANSLVVEKAPVDADGNAANGTQIAAQVADFFRVAGGGTRGAVFANDVDGSGNSYVFVDYNNDGNFTANTDLVFVVVGPTADLTASNILIG